MFSRYDISQYEFLLPLSANNISHPKFSHIESSFSALVLVLALGVLALLGEKKGMKTFASALLIVKPLQLLLLFFLCLTHVNIKIRDLEPTDAQCCTVGYFF